MNAWKSAAPSCAVGLFVGFKTKIYNKKSFQLVCFSQIISNFSANRIIILFMVAMGIAGGRLK
jgi:hypothetical protein